MNLLQFKNSILENKGASYNLLTGELNPENGFMISLYGHESKSLFNDGLALQYTIAEFIKQNALILASNALKDENYFIGAWVNNDILYLDVSINVSDEQTAKEIATNNKQLAYFNNATKETINL